VIASSSCSAMAVRSGDLYGDDTKDTSAATCSPRHHPPIRGWHASNFSRIHPPTQICTATITGVAAPCGQKNTSTIKLGGGLDYPQLALTPGLYLLHVNPSPWRPARKQGGLHVRVATGKQGNISLFYSFTTIGSPLFFLSTTVSSDPLFSLM
jgi:hypothetical protein